MTIAAYHHLPARLASLPVYLSVPLALGVLPVFLALLAISYFAGLTIYRLVAVRVLGIDTYKDLATPQHKSKYYWPLLGDLPEIREAPPADAHISWERTLKTGVYVYRAIFYQPRVILGDWRALNHILGPNNSYSYPKPEGARTFLKDLLGNGLLVAEGDDHRRQRKIIQPAFNVSAVRDLTPLFFRHAHEFANRLADLVDNTKGSSPQAFYEGQSDQMAQISEAKKPVLEISSWLSRVTLDIIGDAGFGHQFASVGRDEKDMDDEIYSSFQSMMRMLVNMNMLEFIRIALSRMPTFEWVNKLPSKRRDALHTSKKALEKTSLRIIERKRSEIIAEADAVGITLGSRDSSAVVKMSDAEKTFFGEEEKGKSKDLLYLMMKANMSPNVRESERMSDAELLGQITTLLTAGHETTSTLSTWLLYVISQPKYKEVQGKLRAEIDEYFAGREELDYDSLMAMPYLDATTKEILRIYSPVVATERVVLKDDVVPLSKPYKSRNGKGTFQAVPVSKGMMLIIPIQMMNRSQDLWGPDADEFRPERWQDIPARAKQTGFPLQLLSFIEGPRGCIGNRFALAEFKAIICALLLKLKFETVDWEIECKQGIVIKPRVVGQEALGTQMPIRVSRL